MAMLLRRLTLLSLVGLLASGAEDSRGRTTAVAATGSGETCEEKEETSHIQVRGSVGVRSNSSAVSTPQRATARRTRVHSSGPGRPEYFQQGYGGIETWSWFTGVVAEDTVELAGAKAPAQRFGLIQMGNTPSGNPYPLFGFDATGSNALGPSASDGIMGLAPGCLRPDSEACKDSQNATDVISHLYWTGAISEHAFTICLHDSEKGGGKLWVGKSSSPFPAGAVSVGLDFMPPAGSITSYYKPAAPEGSPDIPVFLGGEQIYTVNKSGYNALFEGGLIDSGTAGFRMPPEIYKIFTEKIGEIMKADSEVAAVWDEAMQNMSRSVSDGKHIYCCATLSSEVAAKVKSLTPDFSFSIAGANLSVLGSSFLYQSTPCSGEYGISWIPDDDEPPTWKLGSSFFYGRTLHFDLTEKTGPNTAIGTLVMIPDDECLTDYGEYGEGIEVMGVPGQVVGPAGVMTGVVNLGEPPQSFLVQLDTGSQDLMVYQAHCALVGITPIQACVLVSYDENEWLGAQPPQAPKTYSPPECFDYMSTLLHDMAPDREFTEADLPLHAEFSYESMTGLIAKNLVPWMKCGEDHAVCGDRRVFNTTSSTTLKPKNFPKPDFVHSVPDDGFFAHLAPKLNCQPC